MAKFKFLQNSIKTSLLVDQKGKSIISIQGDTVSVDQGINKDEFIDAFLDHLNNWLTQADKESVSTRQALTVSYATLNMLLKHITEKEEIDYDLLTIAKEKCHHIFKDNG